MKREDQNGVYRYAKRKRAVQPNVYYTKAWVLYVSAYQKLIRDALRTWWQSNALDVSGQCYAEFAKASGSSALQADAAIRKAQDAAQPSFDQVNLAVLKSKYEVQYDPHRSVYPVIDATVYAEFGIKKTIVFGTEL